MKSRQRREQKSLGQVASELLARALATENEPVPEFVWHSTSMGDPRVDIDDKEALRAILDSSAG